MSEITIREERLRKLQLLRDAGRDPYPAVTDYTASIPDILNTFDERVAQNEHITIAGRVMARRGQGGIMFTDIFDGSARMQGVLQKTEMSEAEFDLFSDTVDTGDFISITGTLFTTKRGEKSVQVQSWQMLSKSLLQIPDEWTGIKDEELRLRERYIDMLLNPELRAMVERRSRFWHTIRNFLIERGFLEVETPILESSPGGADARPFITHHNALDIDVHLRISAGELWQKVLLVAGFPKVFEIGRIFRNEGQSREHLQDYTQIEFYEAFSDYRKGMQLVQELFRRIAHDVYGRYEFNINGHEVNFAADWETIDFCSIIKEKYGIDPLSCTEAEAIAAVSSAHIKVGEKLNKARAVDHLWKAIRKTITGPAFLTGVPVYLEPLAKRSASDKRIVERMQVLIAGSELGKGYSELNDPQDQRSRFEEQQAMREAGDDEAQRLDESYVRAMEYGMPPAFGFGMSERVFSFLENKSAHETQLFPLLRPKE
ncbi:MAG: lysS [Candidatus Kaiserbacteria bacterium]|nr:lysS [Candidatus Kaiserbacteria bacterium]